MNRIELYDTILTILYDEKILQSHRLTNDELKDRLPKSNPPLTDQQFSFGVTYLEDQLLISHSDLIGGVNRYSLTVKGVEFIATGGCKIFCP